MDRELTLHEEVLLLGLDDDSGRVEPEVFKTLEYTLSGALITELALSGAIRVDGEDADVELVEGATGGDSVQSWALKSMTDHDPAAIDFWIPRFVREADLETDVAELLCARGILEKKKQRFMLIFRGTNFPEKDAAPEKALTERLHDAIFEDGEVSERTAALIALADATQLLHVKFHPEQLKPHAERIHEITSTGIAHEVTIHVIAAARASYIANNIMLTVMHQPFR